MSLLLLLFFLFLFSDSDSEKARTQKGNTVFVIYPEHIQTHTQAPIHSKFIMSLVNGLYFIQRFSSLINHSKHFILRIHPFTHTHIHTEPFFSIHTALATHSHTPMIHQRAIWGLPPNSWFVNLEMEILCLMPTSNIRQNNLWNLVYEVGTSVRLCGRKVEAVPLLYMHVALSKFIFGSM